MEQIVFKDSARIDGRKPGVPYVVDGSLAHHYCDVLGCAERLAKSASAPVPEPGIQDRAMPSPPRGRR